MIFSSKATARVRTGVAALVATVVGALALGLIAACGGGTSQYDPFVPKRLIVFGDENSTITANGRKYSVNGLDGNNAIDCTQQPIWVQSLANAYGFVFAGCNPTQADVTALMQAFAGARVEDVAAQVEAQVAAGGFRDRDLATMLAGANDVFDLYVQYPGRSAESLLAEAGARGRRLALVVNRLVALGVKVVVSDLPDLGLTPYAYNENLISSGSDRSGLLSSLTTAFNEQLGVSIVLDGHFVGLVQAQLRFQAIGRSPASFGLADIVDPVCTVPLPLCTTSTLQIGAVPSQYLWSDDRWLAPGGHNQLATLALDRATRNPF
jgi:phospholipase/lecithinase/hemolysin